jgi:hypothetical protein
VFSVWSFYSQHRFAVETIRNARDTDVIGWTNGVIDVVVAIEFLVRDWSRSLSPKEFTTQRDDQLARLSAMIDKGRLFFPNFSHDVVGTDKPLAFRGHRQAILDRLVEIYDLIKDLDPSRRCATI